MDSIDAPRFADAVLRILHRIFRTALGDDGKPIFLDRE
jgi:hypothetical protein